MSEKLIDKLGDEYRDAIAIIGRNGRFPGAKTVEELWENLKNGVESVSIFSKDDLEEHLKNDVKAVIADALLEDIDMFDAEFFDYSAREAQVMDPQHRLFLECAWEIMEQAGYVSEEYAGKIAVYGGSNLSSYMIRNLYSNPGLVEELGSFKTMIANSQDFVATKVSYKMNFTGTSINVNTLCSSALVATQMACQSLLSYECDVALAGASNIQVTRNESVFYQEGGIGANDGHCRAFDEKASGTVSGSGVAMVLLKRLEDALEDGDSIHAIIRGAAVNNDGAVKNSYTAPNADGQAECIAEAIELSGINPETINFIEAHGTGTNLGDPIEIAALTKAFRAHTDKKQYCAIGSLKTNIGHLVNAGGVASLIKAVESLKARQIPASLNFEKPNPKIDFENSPFYVNTKLSNWESVDGAPLRAGVSSFGIGGTNAHVIVEEAPKIGESGESREYSMINLSAKTGSALEKMSSNLINYIKNNPKAKLADIAYTLQVGRIDFNHKKSIICQNLNELVEKLGKSDGEDVLTHFQKDKTQSVAFIFSKEDKKLCSIGKNLYETETYFAEKVDECLDYINDEFGLKLNFVDGPFDINNEKMVMLKTFVTEYALASLLIEWGVVPEIMIGEGCGEYTAAAISGAISYEDAITLLMAEKEELKSKFDNVEFNDIEIKYYSNRSGDIAKKSEISDINYWLDFDKNADKFSTGAKKLVEDSDMLFVQIGLNNSDAKEISELKDKIKILGNEAENLGLMRALSKMWILGCKISWKEYYMNEKRHRIMLPTYPFERKSYWVKPGTTASVSNEVERVETANEKVIKNNPRPELETEYKEAETLLEKVMAECWQKALGLDKVGIDDNFYELGGDSLRAIQIVSMLKKKNIEFDLEYLVSEETIRKTTPYLKTMSNFNENTVLEENGLKNDEVKSNSFKIIDNITENFDNYAWENLDCFFRPLAIMFKSFNEKYFDQFLFETSYNSIYLPNRKFEYLLSTDNVERFKDLFEEVIKNRFGMKYNTIHFNSEEEMNSKIKQAIDSDERVMIPGDLYSLFYYTRYQVEHHHHYFIIKGYNSKNKVYHVLDNMHIENGTETIYKDFNIKMSDIFDSAKMYTKYFDPKSEKPYFWTLSKESELDETNYLHSLKALQQSYVDVENGNSSILFLEEEFSNKLSEGVKVSYEYNSENIFRDIPGLINFKTVFYDILFKYVEKAGVEKAELDELKALQNTIMELWNSIKLKIFTIVAVGGTDFSSISEDIASNKENEKKFREKYIEMIDRVDIEKLILKEKESINSEFIIKNTGNAVIENLSDGVELFLPKGRAYELWTIQNTAPQLLLDPQEKEKFSIECMVEVENEENSVTFHHEGLLLKFSDGEQYMFGKLLAEKIELLCPVKGENSGVFECGYKGGPVYLKMEKTGDSFNFSYKLEDIGEWSNFYSLIKKEKVDKFGLFARTWNKEEHKMKFRNIRYSIN